MEVDARRVTPGQDAAAVAWWVLVGTAAGALAGGIVGGIGGRLAMLLLRLTSSESVIGVTSDDGFEIGVVTTDTGALIAGMAFFGALNGIAYAAVRSAIPTRLRLPLWALLAAAVVGAQVLHEDGVDFTLLEPAILAVVLFVALPAVAAAVVVLLVERWVAVDPAAHRRLCVALGVAACAGTLALLPGAVVGLVALGLRRFGRVAVMVRRLATVAVPAGIVAVAAVAGLALVRDVSAIL